MSIVPIASVDDPRLDMYRDLPLRKPRPNPNLFIAEGKLLVERLLRSEYDVESILVDRRRLDQLVPQPPADVPIYVAASELMQQILGFQFHQGMIACGHRRPPQALDAIMGPGTKPLLLVVCIDVQDPENLGGILRNCAAFGVHLILLNEHCVDPFSRRALRVSMGTAFKLRIVQIRDLRQQLISLRTVHQTQLAAMVLDPHAQNLAHASAAPRLALLLGNEATGLAPTWLELCDRRFTIPMHNRVDSLNVSVASGIALHHFAHVNAMTAVDGPGLRPPRGELD